VSLPPRTTVRTGPAPARIVLQLSPPRAKQDSGNAHQLGALFHSVVGEQVDRMVSHPQPMEVDWGSRPGTEQPESPKRLLLFLQSEGSEASRVRRVVSLHLPREPLPLCQLLEQAHFAVEQRGPRSGVPHQLAAILKRDSRRAYGSGVPLGSTLVFGPLPGTQPGTVLGIGYRVDLLSAWAPAPRPRVRTSQVLPSKSREAFYAGSRLAPRRPNFPRFLPTLDWPIVPPGPLSGLPFALRSGQVCLR